ncbi:hypothetical protein DPMN_050118 [Dreissena polymorpha]|uniref:Uncharacterized protein n=1 Tax=Dreissena polymorpha TaxID=45954 RepID=A0A9D4HL13_DREPO|nr:hypothetical protein DPMN_050118 [Dreissena polymorpha]
MCVYTTVYKDGEGLGDTGCEIQPVRLAVSVYSSRDDGLVASLDPLLLPGHVGRTIITLTAHFLNVYSKSLKVLEEGISQSFAHGRHELGKPKELLPKKCFLCIMKSKAESHLLHSGSISGFFRHKLEAERLYWMLAGLIFRRKDLCTGPVVL